jgi:hypothetical protein
VSDDARLLVTSVVRHAGRREASGFVRVIDLAARRILMTSTLPESAYRDRDPNARGGLRGVRGVGALADRAVVANAERLFLFDAAWKRVGEITHPWFGGIHDILVEPDGVWVTSTSADLLLKVDWDGKVVADWDWRRDDGLVAALGFRRLPPVDRRRDHRVPDGARGGIWNVVHLNAVSRGAGRMDGLLLSFGRILSPAAYRQRWRASLLGRLARAAGLRRWERGDALGATVEARVGTIEGSSSAIVLVSANGASRVLRHVPGVSVPNHNILQSADRLLYNDTNGGRLVVTHPDPDRPERTIAVPGSPSFPRGLARLSADRYLVGSKDPAAVYVMDVEAGRVETAIPLGGVPNESVYGICVLPPGFDPPPRSLG